MVGVGLGPWAVAEAGRAAWARTQTVVTLGGDCVVCGVLCTRGGIMPPTPGVTGHNLATLKPLNANIEG